MEIWRVGYDGGARPQVMGSRNLTIAFSLHVAFFALFWLYSVFHGLFNKQEEIIPIDLTVVVNENLDGEENEPPPLQKPEPPPPPPKPQPKPKVKEPEKPKELEQIVTNIVAKVDKKEEKKVEKPKEPEPPKKTERELREERIKQREERLRAMRNSAKQVNKTVVKIEVSAPSGNGRTAKKTLSDAEIRRLLNLGYKPGTSEQIANSDLQLGYSLIKSAVEAKWDVPPWTDTLKPMTIRLWFGGGGRIVNCRLEASSGDARADQSIKSAASRVGAIPGLPVSFIKEFSSKGVPVRFVVKPQ